ncbi:hypothetical protein BT67DRAFT_252160 [Trichocladium antarcticum]|uniref:Uncharacterized protein n=1 Tax=Trichocladium antarcticum TaxID=1450529 RepID=A0AAN6UBG7_9PEZI|nr:hypothetical protein BT67DRAFT_252160 [Trichocladium antarcticum]
MGCLENAGPESHLEARAWRDAVRFATQSLSRSILTDDVTRSLPWPDRLFLCGQLCGEPCRPMSGLWLNPTSCCCGRTGAAGNVAGRRRRASPSKHEEPFHCRGEQRPIIDVHIYKGMTKSSPLKVELFVVSDTRMRPVADRPMRYQDEAVQNPQSSHSNALSNRMKLQLVCRTSARTYISQYVGRAGGVVIVWGLAAVLLS